MTPRHAGAEVDALRKFDRFYTRHTGALDEGQLGIDSP